MDCWVQSTPFLIWWVFVGAGNSHLSYSHTMSSTTLNHATKCDLQNGNIAMICEIWERKESQGPPTDLLNQNLSQVVHMHIRI